MADKKYKKMAGASEYNAYANDITLRLGPIQPRGRLVGVKASSSKSGTKTKLVSPDGLPVKQYYLDEHGNKFTQGECRKAIVEVTSVEAGSVKPSENVVVQAGVKKDKVFEYKGFADKVVSDLPAGVFNFTVHNASEVEGIIYPADANGYVFEVDTSDPMNVAQARMLATALARPDKCVLAIGNLNGTQGLFQVSLWHGHIHVRKAFYPSEVRAFDEADSVYPPGSPEALKIQGIIDAITEPFDPEQYVDTMNEKKLAEAPKEVDVMSLLDQFEAGLKHD